MAFGVRYIVVIFGLIMFTSQVSYTQYDITGFTHYTTEHGLTNNNIHSICQDSVGFLWIGTGYGVIRFDGSSFVNLKTINPEFASRDQNISSVRVFGDDEIGIATSYGAFLLSLTDFGIRPLNIRTHENLKNWSWNIIDLGKDVYGNYGVSTKTGFYIFDEQGVQTDSLHYYTIEDIGDSWMLYGRQMTTMPNGQLLQKNANGYNTFNPHRHSIESRFPVPFSDTSLLLKDPELNILFLDSNTIVYVSPREKSINISDRLSKKTTSHQLDEAISKNITWFSTLYKLTDTSLILNGKRGFYIVSIDQGENLIEIGPQLYLPELKINTIFIDKDHRLWLGTSNGLYKQNTSPLIRSYHIYPRPDWDDVSIRWLEPGENVYYVMTFGHGLLTLDANTFEVLDQKIFSKHEETLILGKVLQYNKDILWIASTNGFFSYNTRTKEGRPLSFSNCPACFDGHSALDLYRDRDKNIWLSMNEGNKAYKVDISADTISIFTYSEEYPLLRVNMVFRFGEDAQRNIWFCGDAMARFNLSTQKVDTLIDKLPGQRNAKKPYAMYLNSMNEVWYATHSDNWHVHKPNGEFEILENAKLSPAIWINQTMIDDVLYYVSEEGKLIMLNTKDRNYRILSREDGWKREKVSTIDFIKNPYNGHIMFADGAEIYEFDIAKSIPHKNTLPFISEINVVGKRMVYQPAKEISFRPDETTLHIKFLNLNFEDPDNQKYSYQLSGAGTSSWIEVDKPEVILTQLPAGTYTLALKVEARNNYWPASINTYRITMQAPFYERLSFILPALLLLALGTGLLIRYRMREIRMISNLDRLAAEYELKALHAQMNPHFVFNCLNSIKEMIMSKDNKNANIYLNKFSYLLRSTLDQSKLTKVPLAQTVEYIRNYLEMEKLRFDHFGYSIDIDQALMTENISMAPMLMQPIVENAIWHGLSGKNGSNQIHIRFYAKGDDIVCEVEDFGIGIHAAALKNGSREHQSSAIANIRQRIELLNKKHAADYQLQFTDKSNSGQQGTIVRLSFKNKEYEFD